MYYKIENSMKRRDNVVALTINDMQGNLDEGADTYKILVENAVECIWLFDWMEGCAKYISPSVFNLRGFTVEEAMNETLEDCFTPESAERMKKGTIERLPKFIDGDRSENVVSGTAEYQQYHKDGSIIAVEISTKLILDERTNKIYILGISRNVTERKKSEQKINDELKEKSKKLKEFTDKAYKSDELNNGRIFCFGNFVVYGNDNSAIRWRTLKSKELFAFLLHNKKIDLPKWKICEALWPEYDFEKVDSYLHTSIYKMKKTLLEAGIKIDIRFRNGCYHVNFPNIYCDIDEFDKIVDACILTLKKPYEEIILQYEKALLIYKNDYLDGNDYFWAMSKRERYREQFHAIALSLSHFYMNKQEYACAKRTIFSMLENNQFDEAAHEMLLKIYVLENNRSLFMSHYDKLQKLLLTELGTEPRTSIKELYKSFE